MKSSITIIFLLTIAIQLVPIDRNQENADGAESLYRNGLMTEEVHQIIKTSCYDCHSDSTNYPWYSRIQPVGFWLSKHVKDGKRHLNFSKMMAYTSKRRNHKLEEIIETIESNEMPLKSYTLIHRTTSLSEQQKNIVINWVKSILKK